MQDLEQKRARIETLVKIVVALSVGFVVAPFIFVAIKGLLGLISAAIITILLINLAPWAAAKVANWRLKAIKHEAALNPIETLQNEYANRVNKLSQFRDYIRSFSASVQSFHAKLADVKHQFPNDVATFDDQYRKMVALLDARRDKYNEAKLSLLQFEATINKAKIMWDLGQEAAKMNRVAGIGNEEIFAKIQTETALDSVQKSLNLAFSDLELMLMDEAKVAPKQTDVNPPALTNGAQGNSLELDIEPIKEHAP